MKPLRLLSLLLAALLLPVSILHAQNTAPRTPKDLPAFLGLSDEQHFRWIAVDDALKDTLRAIRADKDMPPATRSQRLSEAFRIAEAARLAILTAPQKEKLASLRVDK